MLMIDMLKILTIFCCQDIVEAKQILDDANNFISRQKPGRDFTSKQAKDNNAMVYVRTMHTGF